MTDELFVNATTQSLDECRTEEELQAVGKRLAKENMSPDDARTMRTTYTECLRAIRMSQPVDHDRYMFEKERLNYFFRSKS